MIQNTIKEGKIVPSEVTVGLLQKAMQESGNDKFLIDGFPRNEENRAAFESVVSLFLCVWLALCMSILKGVSDAWIKGNIFIRAKQGGLCVSHHFSPHSLTYLHAFTSNISRFSVSASFRFAYCLAVLLCKQQW